MERTGYWQFLLILPKNTKPSTAVKSEGKKLQRRLLYLGYEANGKVRGLEPDARAKKSQSQSQSNREGRRQRARWSSPSMGGTNQNELELKVIILSLRRYGQRPPRVPLWPMVRYRSTNEARKDWLRNIPWKLFIYLERTEYQLRVTGARVC